MMNFSDRFVYVAVGLIVVLAGILLGTYAPDRDSVRELFRWTGLIVGTIITFGYLIRWNIKHLKSSRFWLVIILLFLTHVLSLLLVLITIDDWPLILFALITPVEWMLFAPILKWFVRSSAT